MTVIDSPEPGLTVEVDRADGPVPSRRHLNRFVLTCLVLYAVAAVVGLTVLVLPSLRHLVTDQDFSHPFLPPLSEGHLLGTDQLGRDLGWRVLCGLGVSVCVGLGCAALSITLGMIGGIVGGFFGRTASFATQVSIDVTWAFPELLLAVVLVGWLGPGLLTVLVALSVVGWAAFAKIVRGEVLSIRERDYISAARVLGISRTRIAVTHFRRVLQPLATVMGVFYISTAIIAESGLSFLGLGTQPPTPSLGIILAEGRNYLSLTVWPVVLAGTTLTCLVLLMHALADDIRDRNDPKATRRS